MAYRMAAVIVILNDFEGHFPRSFPLCRPFQVQSVEQKSRDAVPAARPLDAVVRLFKCKCLRTICTATYKISAVTRVARSLSDSWASCTYKRHGPNIWVYLIYAETPRRIPTQREPPRCRGRCRDIVNASRRFQTVSASRCLGINWIDRNILYTHYWKNVCNQ